MRIKIICHVNYVIVGQNTNMVKIGLKLVKLQSEVALFNTIFCKTVMLPDFTLKAQKEQ